MFLDPEARCDWKRRARLRIRGSDDAGSKKTSGSDASDGNVIQVRVDAEEVSGADRRPRGLRRNFPPESARRDGIRLRALSGDPCIYPDHLE